jgi:hypothetical protein
LTATTSQYAWGPLIFLPRPQFDAELAAILVSNFARALRRVGNGRTFKLRASEFGIDDGTTIVDSLKPQNP